MSEKFCLKWNDFNSNVSKSFSILRNAKYLHDVTLVSDDHSKVEAHKLVLSACSEYFRDIFENNQHPHPLICFDSISSDDMKNIMDYIYNGEVQIYQENLDRFLTIAQRLKLEGLIDGDAMEEMTNQDFKNESEVEEQNFNSFDPKDTSKSKTKMIGNKPIQPAGTIAIAGNVEDKNVIDEQVHQYMEECDERSYRCTICGKKSKDNLRRVVQKQNMVMHIETHIEGLSYSCPICQKIFRSRNSLKTHKYVFHKTESK